MKPTALFTGNRGLPDSPLVSLVESEIEHVASMWPARGQRGIKRRVLYARFRVKLNQGRSVEDQLKINADGIYSHCRCRGRL
jgi:hypothetical protein